MDRSRIDAYAARMAEAKSRLEQIGWAKLREDEWITPQGDRIRFSYAHLEFRLLTFFKGQNPEQHVILIRPAPVSIPSVEAILFDVAEIPAIRRPLR